jgi:hypothetical protein
MAVEAFADPDFPPPTLSVWEQTKHSWINLPEGMYQQSIETAVTCSPDTVRANAVTTTACCRHSDKLIPVSMSE